MNKEIVIVGLNHRTAPIEVRERIAFDPSQLRASLQCLRALGSPADAERWAADMLRQYPGTYASGVILLQQGQLEKAYALLEKTPPIFMQQIYWEPVFDPFRGTPRFQQLLAKLGCVEEYKIARATQARILKEQEARQ